MSKQATKLPVPAPFCVRCGSEDMTNTKVIDGRRYCADCLREIAEGTQR